MCILDDFGYKRWFFGHLSMIFFYQAKEIMDMKRNNNLLASFGLFECDFWNKEHCLLISAKVNL